MGQTGIVPQDLVLRPFMNQQVNDEFNCKACAFDYWFACKNCRIDNVLIHMYDKVNLGILEELLTEKRGDFEEFAGYVLEYVERKKTEIE